MVEVDPTNDGWGGGLLLFFAFADQERDLGTDTVLDYGAVLNFGTGIDNVDGADIVDGLAGSFDCFGSGIFPTFLGLGEDFDHFDNF
jgi:hypothetical protein